MAKMISKLNQVDNQQGNHKTITAMQTSGRYYAMQLIKQAPPVPISGVYYHLKCDFSSF